MPTKIPTKMFKSASKTPLGRTELCRFVGFLFCDSFCAIRLIFDFGNP